MSENINDIHVLELSKFKENHEGYEIEDIRLNKEVMEKQLDKIILEIIYKKK